MTDEFHGITKDEYIADRLLSSQDWADWRAARGWEPSRRPTRDEMVAHFAAERREWERQQLEGVAERAVIHDGWATPLTPVATLRFAYADPPYIGCAHKYDHPEAMRFDDPREHLALMAHMDANYDGWALSCHEPSLQHLAAPAAQINARVAAWVKPFAAYKANVRVAYTWEPVIWKRTAERREGDPVGRDHLACGIMMEAGLTGAKPPTFARWLQVLLGWQQGDTVDDLFPGTGIVGRTFAEPRLAL